jgi:hypothetical protein
VRGGDAHPPAVRVFDRQLVGKVLRSPPAVAGDIDITVGEPVSGPHVPAERPADVPGGLEMSRYHSRDLVCSSRIGIFESGGKAAMQLCTCGFEL